MNPLAAQPLPTVIAAGTSITTCALPTPTGLTMPTSNDDEDESYAKETVAPGLSLEKLGTKPSSMTLKSSKVSNILLIL
jgi:hypothetical protein